MWGAHIGVKAFERPDGTQFGIRQSTKYGETIDVIRGNGTTIKDGFKVHQW
jgi:filamentous hemagglutinin